MSAKTSSKKTKRSAAERPAPGPDEVRENHRRYVESVKQWARESRGKLAIPGVAPEDLDLILGSLARLDDENRMFFLRPRPGGGFEFPFLATLAKALEETRLDAIVVGDTAGVLHGVPFMKQLVTLLVQSTKESQDKIDQLAARLGGTKPRPISELASVLRIDGQQVPVDILFDTLPG